MKSIDLNWDEELSHVSLTNFHLLFRKRSLVPSTLCTVFLRNEGRYSTRTVSVRVMFRALLDVFSLVFYSHGAVNKYFTRECWIRDDYSQLETRLIKISLE